MDSEEKVDSGKLQKIIDRLRAEGRLPAEEDFVEAALEVRRKYRQPQRNC